MNSDLRTMLTRLANEPSPVEIDLDRKIAEGRRRARRRKLLGGLVSVVILGSTTTTVLSNPFQTTDGASQAADLTTPPGRIEPPGIESFKDVSTARSRELAAQFAKAAPEIAQIPDAVLKDHERMNPDGTPTGSLWAGASGSYKVGSAVNSVALTVTVARPGGLLTVPRVCDGIDASLKNRCSEVRALPDRSKAFIRDSVALGGHQYSVRLVRPDGTEVFVYAGADMPPGSTRDSVVGRDRVVEIAMLITITP